MNKFPIVIIGTAPRCGSTPYTDLIAQQLNMTAFHEPWCKKIVKFNEKYNELQLIKNPFLHKDNYLKYIQYKKMTNKYVVKFFTLDMEHRCPYGEELKNGYKILLMRRDVIGQIASWYIADTRKKFHVMNDEIQKNYIISINPTKISQYIEIVTRSCFFSNLYQEVDKKIYFEDVDFSKLQVQYGKTKQPENINEIRQEIESQMKDTIPKHWRA